MSSTHLDVFEQTLAKTNTWLVDLQSITGSQDLHKTYMTLRAVLHALRDRLPPDETVDLGAQLPMLIRGFFYEGWHPADKPLTYRHKDDFFQRVTKEVPWLEGAELERAVSAVFELLASKLGAGGETAQVRHMLPAELRELWAQPGL